MSNRNNTQILEAAQADFDTFIAQEKWSDARALIDNLGEQGFEYDALVLHQAYNRAYGVYSARENDKEEPTDFESMRPSYPNE